MVPFLGFSRENIFQYKSPPIITQSNCPETAAYIKGVNPYCKQFGTSPSLINLVNSCSFPFWIIILISTKNKFKFIK